MVPLHSGAIGAIETLDVLVVCTGNICRSPMGEALMRRHLATHGIDAHVHSAGTMRWRGPATAEAVQAMSERGLDVSGHRSRELTPALVEASDLVLGMTRAHIDFVALHCPDARERTFMIRELARLGTRVGPRACDEPVPTWLRRVAALREPGLPVGHPQDEIDDPVGQPVEMYRHTATRLDDALDTIARLLVGGPERT
jgi:protein-tyrosine phosphatase